MNKEDFYKRATILTDTNTVSQHLYNDGLNESNLEFAKNTLLFDAIRNQTQLVKVKKEYPVNDIQTIYLDVDLVVFKRNEFDSMFK